MSTVVYSTARSTDGDVADEGHAIDWLFALDHAEAPSPGVAVPSRSGCGAGRPAEERVLGGGDPFDRLPDADHVRVLPRRIGVDRSRPDEMRRYGRRVQPVCVQEPVRGEKLVGVGEGSP